LSAVTIQDGRLALSTNYLKIELDSPAEPNRLVEIRIDRLTQNGLAGRLIA
jgi:hypothetical protein